MNDVTNTYMSTSSQSRPRLDSSPPKLKPIESNGSRRTLLGKGKLTRLEMLDDKLVSFPLAPPPPKNKTDLLRSPEFNAQDPVRPNSQIFDVSSIVLVEDYIKSRSLFGRKKTSVSDLKTSLRAFELEEQIEEVEESYMTRAKSILTMNTQSSLLLTTSHVDECASSAVRTLRSSRSSIHSTASSMATLKLSEQVDFPLAEFSMSQDSSLKYCVICEAPLYEISSHLVGIKSDFTEFVCCNCTERYEVLSRLLDDFDESLAGMHAIPDDVEDIEEALNLPALKRRKYDPFSKTLTDRLKKHLSGESVRFEAAMDRPSAIWLLEAKRKLRWRWRISGLVPRFMKRDERNEQ